MRIAINSGIALTGDIGSPRRREFTVLGDVVNTAARIEELTSPGAIMISGATRAQLDDSIAVQSLGTRQIRGRTATMDLFVVEG
jgi:class 3 adenylate cyclase